MFYIETKITIHLKTDIPFVQTNEAFTKNISLVMLNDPYLKTIHGQQGGFKPYVFSLPYPPEVKTKVYEAGKVYLFTLRSVDEKFSDLLMRELQAHKGLAMYQGSGIDYLKPYGEEEYGYLYLEDYQQIYSYEDGLDTSVLTGSNVI